MRASGVVPQFQVPSRRTPSRLMWIIIALCIVLPPLGLILLWTTARNPLRGKLVISIIALLSMTLMITVYLFNNRPNTYDEKQIPGVSQMQVQESMPPVQTQPQGAVIQPDPNAVAPETNQGVEIIPANPAG